MVSPARTIEVVGLRAVLYDVRKYITDANSLTSANERIGAANEKLAASSVKAAQRNQDAQFARVKANLAAIRSEQDFAKAKIAASQQVEDAERKLARLSQQKSAGLAAGTLNATQLGAINTRIEDAERNAGRLRTALANIDQSAAGRRVTDTGLAQIASEERVRRARLQGISEVEAAEKNLAKTQAQIDAERTARIKTGIALSATVGGLALAGIGVGAISQASKYQTELAKIDALTDTSTEDTKKLGDASLELSKKLPISATDILEANYVALSSGIKSTSTSMEIATLASEAQVAQMGKANDIARVLTAVLNSYGEENISAGAAADILTKAIQEGSAEASDFVGQIGRLVGVAPKLNVKFSELAASVAYLTNTGLTASEATTAVLGVLNELATQSPGQVKALASVGLTFEDILKNIRDNGFLNTLVAVNKRFDEQDESVKQLFPAIRAYNGFLSLTTKNGKNAAQVTDEVQHGVGALGDAFDANKETLANQIQLFKNQLNVALIEIGNQVIPDVVQAVKDLERVFEENKSSIEDFVVGGLQVAIAAIKDFVEGAVTLIGLVADIGQALSDIVGPANASAIALAAIGTALAWALPGGPIIKGLLIISGIIGELNRKGGFGDRAGQKLNDFFGLGSKAQKPLEAKDVRDILDKQGGSIEDAVKTLFKDVDKSFREDLINSMLADLKEKGFNTAKGIVEFDRALDKLNDTSKEGDKTAKDKKVSEKDLNSQIHANHQAIDELAKELKTLAQEFKNSSDKARVVKSPTADLGLFGEITKKLADALQITAVQAGNVQGYDALQASLGRASDRAFQFTKTMATVAYAFQYSATVANTIVRDLARNALEAAQAGNNAIFSRPTREVANLNVQAARNNLDKALTAFRVNPQLEALDKASKNIDKQIASIQRDQKIRDREHKREVDAAKKQADAQQKALDAQLDAMKLSNLIAQHAAEVEQQRLQDLIDSNNEAQSGLQEAFLKSNEDLQKQINAAIGRGDTQGALALVDQQKQLTATYRGQSKTLQQQQEQNQKALKDQERAEKIRQREEQFQEALFEAQKKNTEAAIQEALDRIQNSDAMDAQNNATEDAIQALEDQKTAIADQIQTLQDQKDKYDHIGNRIQELTDVYQAQSDILKAVNEASDKTLLTQAEQAQLAEEFRQKISDSSDAVRKLSGAIGESFIPEVQKAREEFGYFRGAMRALVDQDIQKTLIADGFSPAATAAAIMASAMDDATAKIVALGNGALQTKEQVKTGIAAAIVFGEQALEEAVRSVGSGRPTGTFVFAQGGRTPASGGPFNALLHPNELVVPLNNPTRSRELMAQIPPAVMANSLGRSVSIGSIFGDMSVRGATLDDMRYVALQAVDGAFQSAASVKNRSGSLISPGAGYGGGLIAVNGAGGGGAGGGGQLSYARIGNGGNMGRNPGNWAGKVNQAWYAANPGNFA